MSRLRELALLFLKLGTIGFGGPAAHIAMMETEVVQRRGWLTRAQFLDYVSATNLIPGPNSTELAIHIGYARAGWPGLVIAGACFIAPAALLVTLLAWAYVIHGTLPAVSGVLAGVKAVVIAIVALALWRLGRTALATRLTAVIGVGAAAAVAAGVHELFVLTGAAVAAALARVGTRRDRGPHATLGAMAAAAAADVAGVGMTVRDGAAALALAAVGSVPTPLGLFAVFTKIGAVLFGSGYVLLAFLRADLVLRHGWLTEQQLLDAIAVGQVTPGPLFTTATFVGYVVAGGAGAAAATLGIFLPAFVFVALSGPILPRLRRSVVAGAMLDGVNAASLALMAVVTVHLARAALVDAPLALLAAASLVVLWRWSVNSVWLVAAGAAFGLLLAPR
jgi:chromate transporter